MANKRLEDEQFKKKKFKRIWGTAVLHDVAVAAAVAAQCGLCNGAIFVLIFAWHGHSSSWGHGAHNFERQRHQPRHCVHRSKCNRSVLGCLSIESDKQLVFLRFQVVGISDLATRVFAAFFHCARNDRFGWQRFVVCVGPNCSQQTTHVGFVSNRLGSKLGLECCQRIGFSCGANAIAVHLSFRCRLVCDAV